MNENGQADIGYWQMIEMQKDPAAWITMSGLSYQQTGLNDKPLYTHPSEHDLGIADAIGFERGYKAATVKELTDEEIMSEWEISKDEVEFARAILRKAQEK